MTSEHDIANAESRSATDAAPDLFTPDLLLPSQQSTARPPDSPCRRLVMAVLERALQDAVGPTSKGPEREDALAWFRSNDEDPFSFRWVAFTLGIEPDWLRARISRLRGTAPDAEPAPVPTPRPAAGEDQRAA